MTNIFTRFFRKVTYCEELQSILAEEEELLRKLKEEYWQPGGGISELPPIDYAPVIKLRKQLIYLQRESRKLEELKRLSAIEEDKLTKWDLAVIKQLREKLDKKPLKLLKKEECYCDGKLDTAKYKFILTEFINDEVTFWEYLFQTNMEIRKYELRYIRDVTLAIRDTKRLIKLIKKNYPSWKDEVFQFGDKLYKKYGFTFLNDHWDSIQNKNTDEVIRALELFEYYKGNMRWRTSIKILEITRRINNR